MLLTMQHHPNPHPHTHTHTLLLIIIIHSIRLAVQVETDAAGCRCHFPSARRNPRQGFRCIHYQETVAGRLQGQGSDRGGEQEASSKVMTGQGRAGLDGWLAGWEETNDVCVGRVNIYLVTSN